MLALVPVVMVMFKTAVVGTKSQLEAMNMVESINTQCRRGRSVRPSIILATLASAVAAVLLGPAAVANAEETAQQTISRLQNSGYTVNVDRVGSGRIDDCVVTGVRNPQTVTEYIRVHDGRNEDGSIDWDLVPVIKSKSISVSLNCS